MGKRGRPPHPDILTPREWEVLDHLRERLTNEQIAERLGITPDGAKYHVSQILSKLGVENREEAARWEPQAATGAWWRLLAPLPLAAKVAGVVIVVGAAVGLGLLAWGVAETGGPASSPASRSNTPGTSDCPPGAECPAPILWEATSQYQGEDYGIILTILWLELKPAGGGVFYTLTGPTAGVLIEPGEFTLTDSMGRGYEILDTGSYGSALGVFAGVLSFERPPDAGEALRLSLNGATASDGTPFPEFYVEVEFARNLVGQDGPDYSLGMRIAPENAQGNGATLLYSYQMITVTRDGQEATINWRDSP
jgi:DNA-binding CsgD family transcriptional regulator